MRTRWFGHIGLSAALCVGLSAVAAAQDASAVAQDGQQPAAPLTSAEQVKQAEAVQKKGEQLAATLMARLDESRKEKDIMRANCVNRKLTEVNANVRNLGQRNKALKDAAAAGDQSRSSHEFTVISVLSQKLSALSNEAAQCLGESIYVVGQSQVITTVPADLWPIDSRDIPQEPPPPPAVTVPPPLSPTR